MARERILITVKTYPTLSRKYGETVCTAGIRPDGSWVRIYPVPFRRLDEAERYRKFDWIEIDLVRNHSDPRPETFRPTDYDHFVAKTHLGTEENWRERRKLLLETAEVFDRLDSLMEDAKANRRSLAVFKPAKIRGLIWEDEDREWNTDKVEEMRNKAQQIEMFEQDRWRETFNLIPKMPYSFSYQIEDIAGRKSTMQILDWECSQLYWNCVRKNGGDEVDAVEKVRGKYLEEFGSRDLHLLLGTTQQFHGFSPNPWVIVGVFAPPYEQQPEFDLGL